MFESCLQKQRQIADFFLNLPSEEAKYETIIEWGRKRKPFPEAYKTNANLVSGCQSQLFLHSSLIDGKLAFEIESDALISAGLAVLLIKVYGGESPEAVLKCPPDYLEEIGIGASLTPNRANGLYSLHLRMQQDALRLLTEKEKKK